MKVKPLRLLGWTGAVLLAASAWAFAQWGVLIFLAPQAAPFVLPLETLQTTPLAGVVNPTRLGLSYHFEKSGLKACRLEGPAAVRGAALAGYYGKEINQVLHASRYLEPGSPTWDIARYFQDRWRLWTNRKWLSHFPPEVVKELSGFSLAYSPNSRERRLMFNRLISAQLMLDRLKKHQRFSWLRGSVFGVAAAPSGKGMVLMGRNFDFEKAAILEAHKLVVLNQPDQGYRYLSVTWPGQSGVVTGMNEKGLGIALLSASTAARGPQGIPAALLGRLVMTRAGNLQEAVRLIRTTPLARATSFFLGSGPENRFVVVEKDPKQTVVRVMHDRVLVATNHFLSPGFDLLSPRPRHFLSSRARYQRLLELVNKHKAHMDIRQAAAILRDRAGVHGQRLGAGHPFAINNFTTMHSVIFDLGSLTAWVATSPYHLGAYVPFSMKAFAPGQEGPVVGADPSVKADRYKTFLLYQLGLKEAKRLLHQGQAQEALAWIQEMQPLNKRDYRLYLLAARALNRLHRSDEALYNLRQARRLHPATQQDQQWVNDKINELKTQTF